MGWFQVPVAAPATALAKVRQTVPVAATPQSPAAQTAARKAADPRKAKVRGVAPMAPVTVQNADLKLIVDPVSGSVTDFIVPAYKKADRKADGKRKNSEKEYIRKKNKSP